MEKQITYYRRFHGYDYSKGVSLFITMATEPRASLFGRVRNAQVERSALGEQVFQALEVIPDFNPGIRLFEHELMPDHLHCNLYLPPFTRDGARDSGQGARGGGGARDSGQGARGGGGARDSGQGGARAWERESANRAQLQRLGAAMRKFKTFTTTLARKSLGMSTIWQQGYHDRICVSRRFIDAVTRYIKYNALKYELMYNQPEFMRIREPLDSPRLDTEDFWKGMGNVALLDAGNKLLSLRVARKTRDIGKIVARMEDAVRAGYTIVSGFISPGEVAVRDMLLKNQNAKFIHVLPSCMKNGHRPDSRYLKPLQEGRFLELAEGNDESEFGRSACLQLNEEIVKIACAGEGLGVYWHDERAWQIAPSTRGGARDSGQGARGDGGALDSGQCGAGESGQGSSGDCNLGAALG
ncbi:MAG: hypothetical protein Q4G65_04995 [bacterium]|nr:hypothetical protein [bacterium]